MKQAIRIVIVSAILTAAALKTAPALAQAATAETQVSVVTTGDLDLSSRQGQRQLKLRLVHAAAELCGGASDADLQGKLAARSCRAEVLANANAQGRQIVLASRGMRGVAVASAR